MPLAPGSPGLSTWLSANGWKVRSSSTPTVNGSIGMLLGGSCAVSLAVPGSVSGSDRTRCVTPSSPPPWTPVSRFVTCRRRPVTPIRGRRCATTVAANRWTVTPPISSPRSSPVPPAETTPSGVRCRARARPGRRNTNHQREQAAAQARRWIRQLVATSEAADRSSHAPDRAFGVLPGGSPPDARRSGDWRSQRCGILRCVAVGRAEWAVVDRLSSEVLASRLTHGC